MKKVLFATTALVAASSPAAATTWDFSTLNATVHNPAPHYDVCPCTDPITGTTIFNASNSQLNGWTIGTDTIYYMGDGRGNNAGKPYLPNSGTAFPLPTTGSEQTQGINNSPISGLFAQADGFPLYFWFGNPGSALLSSATGVPVSLNSLWISGGQGTLTITGFSDLGHTVGGGGTDTMTLTLPGGTTAFQVPIGWAGIEEVDLTGAASYYVNDIRVNDPVISAVPGPIVGAGLPGLIVACGGLLALARRRRQKTA